MPDVVNGNIKIIGDYNFEKDFYVKGNLNLESGKMTLNGKKITSEGNLYIYDVNLTVDKGTLDCYGNCTFQSLYYLRMQEADGVINVKGDFTFYSGSTYNYVTNGKIYIGGNCISCYFSAFSYKFASYIYII